MRAVIQRVTEASVTIEDEVVGKIGAGLVVLLGVTEGDTSQDAAKLADKIAQLRIFNDADGKFNLSALDVGGEILVISQFTLYANSRRGRRPSFTAAAPPDIAAPLVDEFIGFVSQTGLHVEQGEFGAMMLVKIFNDGPVTIILDTEEWR